MHPLRSDPVPAIRRRLMVWQIAIFGSIIAGITTMNIFTTLANKANDGVHLSPVEPAIWEYSSAVMLWLLIPCIAWFNRRAMIGARTWKWTVPLHLLATVAFSVVHVTGMVLLRKLAYAIAGAHYSFGPVFDTWVYEYRKDFMAYWMILAGLYAFGVYRLWLEDRQPLPADPSAPPDRTGVERLVVKKFNREFILNSVDIDRIEADGNYVTIHAQGKTYPLRESMVALERKLDPARFARVHRGHIVNLDRIREIQPWDSGDYRIVLQDGSLVNFSRRYRSRLPQLFDS
jgi:hypothetical protein